MFPRSSLVIKENGQNAAALGKAQKTGRIVWLVIVYAFFIFMSLRRDLPVLLDDHHFA
jgi:hypothetical protein